MNNETNLTLEELAILLSENAIDTSHWHHQYGNKTLLQLQQEMEEGETELIFIDSQLHRKVRVSAIEVIVKLGEQNFQLIEDKQIYFSGKIIPRELKTITEKLKRNETPLNGAYRGLQEEIGLNLTQPLTYVGQNQSTQISPSYPTLMSCYEVFNYRTILGENDLKNIRFSEYQEGEKRLSLYTLIPHLNNN